MLQCHMASAVPESEIPQSIGGRLLLAGLFCVGRKDEYDRRIVDHRPQNSLEKQLGWSRLPPGCQLCCWPKAGGLRVERRLTYICLSSA
jgi:hypothetical protein